MIYCYNCIHIILIFLIKRFYAQFAKKTINKLRKITYINIFKPWWKIICSIRFSRFLIFFKIYDWHLFISSSPRVFFQTLKSCKCHNLYPSYDFTCAPKSLPWTRKIRYNIHIVCSLVGLLSFWHNPHFHSQFNVFKTIVIIEFFDNFRLQKKRQKWHCSLDFIFPSIFILNNTRTLGLLESIIAIVF